MNHANLTRIGDNQYEQIKKQNPFPAGGAGDGHAARVNSDGERGGGISGHGCEDDAFLRDMHHRGNHLYVHLSTDGKEYIVLAKRLAFGELRPGDAGS